jgi:hypothetical protein
MGTAKRLIDPQGHDWPVTGYWCAVCGMPLHKILLGDGVHPNCEAQHVLSESRGGHQGGAGVGALDSPLHATLQPEVPSDDVHKGPLTEVTKSGP